MSFTNPFAEHGEQPFGSEFEFWNESTSPKGGDKGASVPSVEALWDALGLEMPDDVLGAAPDTTGSPDGIGLIAPSLLAGAIDLLDPLLATAKGGPSGGPGSGGAGGGGGGKGGGTTDPGVLDSYISGEGGSTEAGDASSAFNIEIQFSGTWTVELQQAFVDVSEFLSDIILGDLADITKGRFVTDDITISAKLSDIDGSGGILGQAGPTAARTSDQTPVAGTMEFDIADAQDMLNAGSWDEVVFHEMMHCLGFGTLWDYAGMTSGTIADGDLLFTGTYATLEYDPTAAGVPIETDFGSGTAGGHWDELIFGNEIMTGFIYDYYDPTVDTNYLSIMTIAALEDYGYDTIYDAPGDDLTGIMPSDDFLFA